jgi:predicted RNase H-like HicB family nuclease
MMDIWVETARMVLYVSVMKFTVILEPERGGGYSVVCPAVPGCVSQGEDLPAALANIREAIILCLEVRREDRMIPMVETPELIAREIQDCLEDRAAEGLPLTIETQEVDVEVKLAA